MPFTSEESKTSSCVDSAMLKKKQLIIDFFPTCDRIIDILTCRHLFCVTNFNFITLVPKKINDFHNYFALLYNFASFVHQYLATLYFSLHIIWLTICGLNRNSWTALIDEVAQRHNYHPTLKQVGSVRVLLVLWSKKFLFVTSRHKCEERLRQNNFLKRNVPSYLYVLTGALWRLRLKTSAYKGSGIWRRMSSSKLLKMYVHIWCAYLV